MENTNQVALIGAIGVLLAAIIVTVPKVYELKSEPPNSPAAVAANPKRAVETEARSKTDPPKSSIQQSTIGDKSPNIANTRGDIRIEFQ